MTLDGEVFDALILTSGVADEPVLGADIVGDVPGGVPALVGLNVPAPMLLIRRINVPCHDAHDRGLVDGQVSKKVRIWQP